MITSMMFLIKSEMMVVMQHWKVAGALHYPKAILR